MDEVGKVVKEESLGGNSEKKLKEDWKNVRMGGNGHDNEFPSRPIILTQQSLSANDSLPVSIGCRDESTGVKWQQKFDIGYNGDRGGIGLSQLDEPHSSSTPPGRRPLDNETSAIKDQTIFIGSASGRAPAVSPTNEHKRVY